MKTCPPRGADFNPDFFFEMSPEKTWWHIPSPYLYDFFPFESQAA